MSKGNEYIDGMVSSLGGTTKRFVKKWISRSNVSTIQNEGREFLFVCNK
jgi:hypothetical protein